MIKCLPSSESQVITKHVGRTALVSPRPRVSPSHPNFTRLGTSPASILIVDDHPLFRAGAKAWIDNQPPLRWCGEASAGPQADHLVRTQRPDLILLGLRLGGEDTIGLIQHWLRHHPNLRVLAVGQTNDVLLAESALRAGARGVVLKDQTAAELQSAVETVLQGEIWVNARLTSSILKKAFFSPQADEIAGKLSHRELEVFTLIGFGRSAREIAVELGVSRRTVNVHRENIKRKLGLKGAPNLVFAAITWTQTHSVPAPTDLVATSSVLA